MNKPKRKKGYYKTLVRQIMDPKFKGKHWKTCQRYEEELYKIQSHRHGSLGDYPDELV